MPGISSLQAYKKVAGILVVPFFLNALLFHDSITLLIVVPVTQPFGLLRTFSCFRITYKNEGLTLRNTWSSRARFSIHALIWSSSRFFNVCFSLSRSGLYTLILAACPKSSTN